MSGAVEQWVAWWCPACQSSCHLYRVAEGALFAAIHDRLHHRTHPTATLTPIERTPAT